MDKLRLFYKGRDDWDRPVYKANGRLYVDVDPNSVHATICTKVNNKFDGEPDCPIKDGIEVEFVPRRDTWY